MECDQAQTLFIEGNRLMDEGDTEGAEECFRQVLALVPDCGEALANLALLRKQKGAVAEAEECYRRAIALLPRHFRVHLNMGVLLMEQRRFAEAEAVYRQALRLAPDSPAAWTNLGVLLVCMKRDDEAERCYRTAIELNGDYSNAYFNLSYVLLRHGRFEEGWRCLQWRQLPYDLGRHFSFPHWRGEALHGKSLIIGFDAGRGDMIQFCRYASVLKGMGAARIAVICHPDLRTLFKTLSGVDEVLPFPEGAPVSGWDFWAFPMSLPYYCRTRLHDIPAPIPYLKADPAKVAKWSALLPPSGFRVGLVWKGNPGFENDEDRSLPSLDFLAPLGEVPGVHFVGLQKGQGEEEAERPPVGMTLLALGAALKDFADTAAIVTCLDLVISVDTAVAHLAGALGTSCWVLLPDYWTDWRWLIERTDSPWYPNVMRLFRQPSGGGWTPVINAVVDALKSYKREWDSAAGS